MKEISLTIVFTVITYGVYRLFELFVRRKERMAIIEKLSQIDPGVPNSNLKLSIFTESNGSTWAIRIGLLLLGIGLGVATATIAELAIVAPYEPDSQLYHQYRNTIVALYPACAAMFGGLGLVFAYFIEKKQEEKRRKEN